MSKPCAVYKCTNGADTYVLQIGHTYRKRTPLYRCNEHHDIWRDLKRTIGIYNHVETDEYNWIESHLNYDSSDIIDTGHGKIAYYLFNNKRVILMIRKDEIHIFHEFGYTDDYIHYDEFVYDNVDKKNKINEYTFVPTWRKIIRASNIFPNILPRDLTGMIELFL